MAERLPRYIEYLDWMKAKRPALPVDKAADLGRRTYPHHPIPIWLMDRISAMPVGFAAIAQTTFLSLDTMDLIQTSCALNASFASQSLNMNRDDIPRLKQLAKETNFRCNDLLLQRKLNRVEEILVLGLSSHCQYIAQDMALRFRTPKVGLGVSMLLFKLSCTFLAREPGLMTILHLNSPSISNTMVWAGSMLAATSPEAEPAWSLGQRLLRVCEDDLKLDEPRKSTMCREDFLWPETLPV